MHKIYSLLKDGEVVYVGQSKNLSRRIREHKRDKNFDSFEILEEVEDLKCAYEVEDRFIMLFNPKYNYALNSHGSYIKLGERLKGKTLDEESFVSYMQDYNVKPIFADNYCGYTVIMIIEVCEIKEG